ncbi:TPA: hypothetical protein EYP38_03295 [Candidatus Micrarchaeota archaeon]|nr:hypothetical protein [Candidatus Micrarchaeota archaeon]
MKIKLTPELSYIIGLWRKCRVFDGLGVKGGKGLLEVFSKEALEKGLTTSEKLLTDDAGESVFFHHTAYKKFFQDIEKDQMQRFKYLNEYAANYLAGMFDAVGDIDDKGIVSMRKMNRNDEMMLLRLGFHSKRKGEFLIIERPVIFLAFIKNFVKLKKDHKAFEYLNR